MLDIEFFGAGKATARPITLVWPNHLWPDIRTRLIEAQVAAGFSPNSPDYPIAAITTPSLFGPQHLIIDLDPCDMQTISAVVEAAKSGSDHHITLLLPRETDKLQPVLALTAKALTITATDVSRVKQRTKFIEFLAERHPRKVSDAAAVTAALNRYCSEHTDKLDAPALANLHDLLLTVAVTDAGKLNAKIAAEILPAPDKHNRLIDTVAEYCATPEIARARDNLIREFGRIATAAGNTRAAVFQLESAVEDLLVTNASLNPTTQADMPKWKRKSLERHEQINSNRLIRFAFILAMNEPALLTGHAVIILDNLMGEISRPAEITSYRS